MISAWLAAAAVAAADSYPPNAISVARAEVSPVIDGRLDDPAWRDVHPIGDFHQQRPQYRAPPSEATRVQITYDDDHFYIAAKLFDRDPEQIRARQLIQGRDISADDRL